jgi:hypothetical protein
MQKMTRRAQETIRINHEEWAILRQNKGLIMPKGPTTSHIEIKEQRKQEPEPTQRHQEIREESKKTIGVYVRHEIGFDFSSFSFLCSLQTDFVSSSVRL